MRSRRMQHGNHYYIRELSHPNYRQLSWGLQHLNLPRSTFYSTRMKVFSLKSLTSSDLRWIPDPELSDSAVERLELHYRTKDAVSMCYGANPLIKEHPEMWQLQEKVYKLTGCSNVFLNDFRFISKLKSKLPDKGADGDSTENDGDTLRSESTLSPRPDRSKPRSVSRLLQFLSPVLPVPTEEVEKSFGERPRSNSLLKIGELGTVAPEVLHSFAPKVSKRLTRKQRLQFMNDLFLNKEKQSEPVSSVISRHLPEIGNHINTMYDLADLALSQPQVIFGKQKRIKTKIT
ncbi:hypothetical protein PHET_01449 [Paragonimus heterotremus]|uniref:Uncharacterized protein n=1 Tax=Paragonimus heterotremus TaxID=100268 RepID=A0A8J4TE67_9TREM|nr:hypothetical protein PHET_01449 [Paragonimus heterotremus]